MLPWEICLQGVSRNVTNSHSLWDEYRFFRRRNNSRNSATYILMEKSYCALYKLTGQVTGTHPRVEIASGQSLGHVLLFGPTPTHDSLSFYSVEKHILSNFNAVIVMLRLAEQPPDFNRLISSMRRRCQACVNAGGGHTRYWDLRKRLLTPPLFEPKWN